MPNNEKKTTEPMLVPRLRHVGVRKDKEPGLIDCVKCNNLWTWHTFHKKEQIHDLEGQLVGTHDQYKCLACGTLRRWG